MLATINVDADIAFDFEQAKIGDFYTRALSLFPADLKKRFDLRLLRHGMKIRFLPV